MNKCSGCGAIFQSEDINKEGYIRKENIEKSKICERCFRIRNYNEYQIINKTNEDFIEILKTINKTDDLVILVIDLLNINKDLFEITKYLNNDILVVYTKRDALPLLVKDAKLLSYDIGINYIDSIIVSSNNNYNLDGLFERINQYKKSENVYIVGYSNVGKSTLINKIIYNYSELDTTITTSMLPSTTIDMIKIKLNEELTLIDTPGIIEKGSIINLVDDKTLKKILPKKEIKPITFQIRAKQYIFIENLVKIDLENNNNLTIYVSNNLNVERSFKNKTNDLVKQTIKVESNNDIVIKGLGFIKVTHSDVLDIYTLEGVEIYTRESLI